MMTGMRSASRIVVAPLNLALRAPAGVSLDTELVRVELARHFQQMDRAVKEIEPVGASRIWAESHAELTETGAKPDLAVTSKNFAQRLAQHAEYDLLIMPSLLLRSARVVGTDAYWDGVRRRLPVKSIAPFGPIEALEPTGIRVSQRGFRGRVTAVSLYVEVLTPDGRSVYQGIGGLDVLQEARLARAGSRSWELVDRTDALAERSDLSSGIDVAFERQLPRIAAAW
jgi:hypothetical protein